MSEHSRDRKMKDSGVAWIGEIPEEWVLTKVKNAIKLVGSGTTPKNTGTEYYDGEIPWIQSGDLYGRKEILDVSKTVNMAAIEDYGALNIYVHDFVVVAMYGASVGNVAISKIDACTNQACCVMKSNAENDLNFLYYWLCTCKDDFIAQTLGGSQPNINQGKIRNQHYLLPSIAEQHRIADYLDRKCAQIDSIISSQQAIIEKLKEYKLSLITEAVTKGLNPDVPMKDSGVEWIGEVPEGWNVIKAKNLAERITVGVVVRPSEYFDDAGTVPFLRGMNVKGYSISTDNLVFITEETNQTLSKTIVHTGDILVVRDGSIGTACVVPESLDGSNVISMIILTARKSHNPHYLCYCLNSGVGKMQFELTKIGSALTHTSVSSVSKIQLTVPPRKIQDDIVSYLDKKSEKIEDIIAQKQTLISQLTAYKKSLIYEAVTGKREI